MRITFDISPWVHYHAGLGRYAGELLTALTEVAPNHEYIALYNSPRVERTEGLLPNLKTWRTPLGAKPWRMSVLLGYYMGMSMDRWLPRSDLFHGTDHLLPPLKHSRTVFTIHDLIFRFFPEYHLPLNRWYLSLMLPKFMERANAIIAVSEHTRRDVVQWLNIPAEKITVIYEGVNPAFKPIKNRDELERVRAEYQLPSRFMLFFSTLEPRKNLVTLLDAYAELLKQDADMPLLVVAGRQGWLYQATLQHIHELGLTQRVILTDWVQERDVPALLNLAEVFVYPSLYEGFGLPPLEAMACGTPVISSNAASLPEVVGDGGILFDPRDTEALTQALGRVLHDFALREELCAKGIRRASCFTWERAARETLAVYERVIHK
ncbi:MAG TPA: glycosyltransferase family 1 protein [Anaerolineae bacterium]|nr:glycosyltransferase family 1 protein [Anaerolineae bacterium]